MTDKRRVTVIMGKNDYFVKMNKLINDKHRYEALNVTSHLHSNEDLTTNYLT